MHLSGTADPVKKSIVSDGNPLGELPGKQAGLKEGPGSRRRNGENRSNRSRQSQHRAAKRAGQTGRGYHVCHCIIRTYPSVSCSAPIGSIGTSSAGKCLRAAEEINRGLSNRLPFPLRPPSGFKRMDNEFSVQSTGSPSTPSHGFRFFEVPAASNKELPAGSGKSQFSPEGGRHLIRPLTVGIPFGHSVLLVNEHCTSSGPWSSSGRGGVTHRLTARVIKRTWARALVQSRCKAKRNHAHASSHTVS